MADQERALWLADRLEAYWPADTLARRYRERQAAAELRRLHALNGELLEALKRAHTWLQGSEPGRAQYLGEVIAKAEGEPK
jgi:hypothetical protein